jgi:hypothetical protein
MIYFSPIFRINGPHMRFDYADYMEILAVVENAKETVKRL